MSKFRTSHRREAVIRDISVSTTISTGSRRIRRVRAIHFVLLSLFLKRYRKTHALSFFDVIVWVLRKFVSWVSKLSDAICEECLWLPASRLSERPSSTILLLPAGNHSTHWYSVLFVARYHQYCANCALPLRPQKLNKSTLHSIVPITSRADIFTVEIAVICCTNC